MSERTVTIDTGDHGRITIPEPDWCLGEHPAVHRRADITHDGAEIAAVVDTASGPAEFLRAWTSHAPFAELPPEPFPAAVVELDEAHAMSPDELRAVVAVARAHLDRLERLADEVEALRGGTS